MQNSNVCQHQLFRQDAALLDRNGSMNPEKFKMMIIIEPLRFNTSPANGARIFEPAGLGAGVTVVAIKSPTRWTRTQLVGLGATDPACHKIKFR